VKDLSQGLRCPDEEISKQKAEERPHETTCSATNRIRAMKLRLQCWNFRLFKHILARFWNTSLTGYDKCCSKLHWASEQMGINRMTQVCSDSNSCSCQIIWPVLWQGIFAHISASYLPSDYPFGRLDFSPMYTIYENKAPAVLKFKPLLTIPVVTILSIRTRTLSTSGWTGFTSIVQNGEFHVYVQIQGDSEIFLMYMQRIW
jgi:hypothetical protein